MQKTSNDLAAIAVETMQDLSDRYPELTNVELLCIGNIIVCYSTTKTTNDYIEGE